MLESLDQSNIKRMSVEEPEQTAQDWFDPETEISKEDWVLAITHLNQNMQVKGETGAVYRDMAYAKMIFPDRIPNPSFSEPFDHLNALAEKALKEVDDPVSYVKYFDYLAAGKILYGKVPTISLLNHPDLVKAALKIIRERVGVTTFGSTVYNLKILRPDFEFITPDQVEELARRVPYISHDLTRFVRMAELRVIDPKRKITISPEDWHRMREGLHIYKEGKSWRGFLHLASSMKILAAERVRITDMGIEFDMPAQPENLDQSIPPQPEVRNF